MATPTEQPNNLLMGRQNVFVDISVQLIQYASDDTIH